MLEGCTELGERQLTSSFSFVIAFKPDIFVTYDDPRPKTTV